MSRYLSLDELLLGVVALYIDIIIIIMIIIIVMMTRTYILSTASCDMGCYLRKMKQILSLMPFACPARKPMKQ